MQCLILLSLSAFLLVLLPKAGLGIPFMWPRGRLGMMDPLMFEMLNPEMMRRLQKNAFEESEFEVLVDLCKDYISKDKNEVNLEQLGDLAPQVLEQCENYNQERPGDYNKLSLLMQMVTKHPKASIIFNRKE